MNKVSCGLPAHARRVLLTGDRGLKRLIGARFIDRHRNLLGETIITHDVHSVMTHLSSEDRSIVIVEQTMPDDTFKSPATFASYLKPRHPNMTFVVFGSSFESEMMTSCVDAFVSLSSKDSCRHIVDILGHCPIEELVPQRLMQLPECVLQAQAYLSHSN